MRTITLFIAAILFSVNLTAQKRNYIWCFGDSAGIDFDNLSNPATFASGNDTRGSNCAIADSSGNLLFYATTTYWPLFSQGYAKCGAIYNRNHQVMLNGDTIIGEAWFSEVVIIPFAGTDSMYYVFFAGVTSIYGLYYCTVNMNGNGGLGEIVSKNVLLQPFAQIDCLKAIKHGNGRDWWLFFRRWYPGPLTPNNEFYRYLISPSGLSNFGVQNIGSLTTTNGGKISFSKSGEKMIYTNYRWLIELYGFDRCTGIISNPITIQPENTVDFTRAYFYSEFSPNEKVLYTSVFVKNASTYLLQYNLDTTNIPATRDTIWTQAYPVNAAGALKLAPDDKIYFACAYVSLTAINYPYADSMYNMYNMNLSVINQPDSLGAACDFQPYSFYLGGKRTYWGLPNNPDYDMPALAGSPCDTLTGLNPGPLPKERGAELFLTWVGSWQKLFVNAQGLKGRNVTVEVVDVSGKNLSGCCHAEVRGISQNSYFTKDIFLPNLSAGVYIVRLKTEKEVLAKKFVKE